MAEPYTDEQLEQPSPFFQALDEQLSPNQRDQLRLHLARIAATIERLRVERDAAYREALADMVEIGERPCWPALAFKDAAARLRRRRAGVVNWESEEDV